MATTTVFISYAWESDAFRTQVKALRDYLLANGVAVVSDFDHAIKPPQLGWPSWMQHAIEDAAVVLVVCSPAYRLRFEKRAPPDSGKGVAWEGAVITQDLYNAAQRNDKFFPIFPDPIKFSDCPKALEPWSNGHAFPSKNADILALIHACLGSSHSPTSPPPHAHPSPHNPAPFNPPAASRGNTTINISGSTIHGNITAADLIQGSFNQGNSARSALTASRPAGARFTIYLAAADELERERTEFELFLHQQNDYYQDQGIYLKIVHAQTLSNAMSATRKQDDYNAAARNCDIFVSLFATKISQQTEEEFDHAHAQFLKTGRPYIYTFFKDASVSVTNADRTALQSLWAFQDKLKKLGHADTMFNTIDHLKLRFSEQLKHLLKPGKLG